MRLLALICALPLAGCLVSPADDMVEVTFALELPRPTDLGTLQPVDAQRAWDLQDRFHLSEFSRFVRVAVEVEDYELATGSWPAHPASEAESWVTADGLQTPVIGLSVPAGRERRVSAIAYDRQATGVAFYATRTAVPIDLLAGKTPSVELEMVPARSGGAAISLRCDDNIYRPFLKAELAVIDARAQVVLPPRPLEGVAPSYSILQWEGLPLGRPFRMQVLLQDELSASYRLLELIAPTFTLTDADALQGVTVEIDCGA